jgi:putative GTP pyrophosphokinase
MKVIIPKYTRSQVVKAGKVLRNEIGDWPAYYAAMDILDNWRSAHNFPLNTFAMRLNGLAKTVGGDCILAQRLKRAPSVVSKLKRQPSMSLANMQDIAGCRVVFKNVEQVYQLKEKLLTRKVEHKLERINDYIKTPNSDSGYRSLHLIYEYQSERKPEFNGLNVEIQIRTQIQHAWATAVEMVDILENTSLKTHQGPDNWKEYFKLVSSGFAYLESTAVCHQDHQDATTLREKIRSQTQALDVKSKLRNYNVALQYADSKKKDAFYFLMDFRESENMVYIEKFKKGESEQATNRYMEKEKINQIEKKDQIVLVSVGSVKKLKQAYPNFFLDSRLFISYLDQVLKTE